MKWWAKRKKTLRHWPRIFSWAGILFLWLSSCLLTLIFPIRAPNMRNWNFKIAYGHTNRNGGSGCPENRNNNAHQTRGARYIVITFAYVWLNGVFRSSMRNFLIRILVFTLKFMRIALPLLSSWIGAWVESTFCRYDYKRWYLGTFRTIIQWPTEGDVIKKLPKHITFHHIQLRDSTTVVFINIFLINTML